MTSFCFLLWVSCVSRRFHCCNKWPPCLSVLQQHLALPLQRALLSYLPWTSLKGHPQPGQAAATQQRRPSQAMPDTEDTCLDVAGHNCSPSIGCRATASPGCGMRQCPLQQWMMHMDVSTVNGERDYHGGLDAPFFYWVLCFLMCRIALHVLDWFICLWCIVHVLSQSVLSLVNL